MKFTKCIHWMKEDWQNDECPYCRIYELEFRNRWIPVSERLPENDNPVLAVARYNEDKGYRKVIRASYARINEIPLGDGCEPWPLCTFDPVEGEYFVPEGWYETNEYEDVNYQVTHWMPLPDLPVKTD